MNQFQTLLWLLCLLCLNKVMFGDGSLFTAADKTGLLVMATKHGHRHTHRHTDTDTDRQTDRQTDRHTHTLLHYPLLNVQ